MPISPLQHRRTHNLLLISKLLNQRDATSPFTLLLDSLEQSGQPVLAEYIKRANAAKVSVVFVSFETLRRPQNIDVFIPAWNQTLQSWHREVVSITRPVAGKRTLLIFDTLNPLSATEASNLPSLLASLINPSTSLLALYHKDLSLPIATSRRDPYSPSPLTLLKYLATTILTTHSPHHVLARKAARDRSVVEPSFGLEEGFEGVLQGVGANVASEGLVLEMEHRRKSGRGVREWYFMPSAATKLETSSAVGGVRGNGRETVTLLEDHPGYRTKGDDGAVGGEAEMEATTFELGLTEKQRRDREDVVLPYFDAQKGGGEGGRILYDMGEEDDFDEEEDEI